MKTNDLSELVLMKMQRLVKEYPAELFFCLAMAWAPSEARTMMEILGKPLRLKRLQYVVSQLSGFQLQTSTTTN